MDRYEFLKMENWSNYSNNGGNMDFEKFYAIPLKQQATLVRMRKWANRNL
jgi:hypothetical protein